MFKVRNFGFNRFLVLSLLAVMLLSQAAFAQNLTLSEETYKKPSQEIIDLALNESYKNVSLNNISPDKANFIITHRSGVVGLETMAKKSYNLGELEIDPAGNRLRSMNYSYSVGFDIFNHETGTKTAVQIPKNSRVSRPVWAPDGTKFAYFAHFDNKTEIWYANVKDGKSKRVTKTPVLAVLVTNFEWTADSKSIFTVLVPSNRGPEPARAPDKVDPQIRMTNSKKIPSRTYRFLLKSTLDNELLEYFMTGQLAKVEVKNGKVTKIGTPDMIRSIDPSPDAMHVYSTTYQKPFSYIAPYRSFGFVSEIVDMKGEVMVELATKKLDEATVRSGGSRGGNGGDDKRSFSWRPDGAGLSFLEMEPKPKKDEDAKEEEKEDDEEAPKRKDRVMLWKAPFGEGDTEVVYESEEKIGSIVYCRIAKWMFMTETVKGKSHLYAVPMAEKESKFTIYKHKSSDRYSNPGRLWTETIENNTTAVRFSTDGGVFLSGTKIFKDPENNAPRPFVDKVMVRTGEKTRVFESSADVYESFVTPLDKDMTSLFITRETPTMVRDTYLKTSSGLKKLTENKDYTEFITKTERHYDQITRVDGKKFWSTITLPPNYKKGTKLPALFWFYPREYTSQKSYNESRMRYNKNSFPTIRTRDWRIFTKLGYAVITPDLPIFGDAGKMNDNYHPDLRNTFWALIDFYDKLEMIDRDRLGLGGHSYGAMGTAHAMNDTPFFKAGIAGNGNYNRMLTPITFQSERRWLWDNKELYNSMSAITRVNQMNGALLMYHGQDDTNNGTFPINSDRYFHAMNSLGKNAALYRYPYERHGPVTKETQLDMWARWVEWMDTYVMNPKAADEDKKDDVDGDKGKK